MVTSLLNVCQKIRDAVAVFADAVAKFWQGILNHFGVCKRKPITSKPLNIPLVKSWNYCHYKPPQTFRRHLPYQNRQFRRNGHVKIS